MIEEERALAARDAPEHGEEADVQREPLELLLRLRRESLTLVRVCTGV